MPNNEYTLKNENYKKTEITLSNITIVKEALQEFAYSHFKGSCFSINFFGKIDKDFRVIAIIGEADNDNIIFKTNPEELDKKFRFGVFNIKKNILGTRSCHLIKFNQNDILDKILRYISYERFEGGYFTKGKFVGIDYRDLKFIGICGDIKNEYSISLINLDTFILSMPKLTKRNNFYISKFI